MSWRVLGLNLHCVVLVVNCVVLLLIVCKCVLYYCHGVSTQLQLTNISITLHIKVQ